MVTKACWVNAKSSCVLHNNIVSDYGEEVMSTNNEQICNSKHKLLHCVVPILQN